MIKRLGLVALLLLLCVGYVEAAFTEFYCDPSNGSNVNSGSTTSASAAYTCTNSNWDGTSVFTPTDGSTPASTVNVGDFASVYLDGASTAVYVARVTTVAAGVNGAITLSTTAKCGTAPTSGASGRTIKVGGAWKGPNAADGVPLTIISTALTNASGDTPRVNFKNNATYSVSSGITTTGTGPVVLQGYASSVADGGRATIDSSTNAIVTLTLGASFDSSVLADFVFPQTASSGTLNTLSVSSGCIGTQLLRCKFTGSRLEAVAATGDGTVLSECEFTTWNQSNSSNRYAVANFSGGNLVLHRCYLHNSSGNANRHGVQCAQALILSHCIFDTIGGIGVNISGNENNIVILSCDFYNCGSDAIRNSSTTNINGRSIIIQNCNFVKNNGYAYNGSGTQNVAGFMYNSGFGAGTQANSSGNTTGLKGIQEIGSVSYASNVTPWNDPTTNDFTITLSTAKAAGRGAFGTGLSNTVAYPDIGAVQSFGGGISAARVMNHAN
jgi:hypothetical protein